MSQNYGLGRGLSSLIPQKSKKIAEPEKDFNYFGAASVQNVVGNTSSGQVLEVEIFRIVPNPHQPRVHFNEEKLQELSESIKKHGILQPIVVSKSDNQYEIIAGERRFQAAKLAGLKQVPVILKEVNDQDKLELAIIENIQRHDLNSIEEAKAYAKLAQDFDMSQEEVAARMGKSRSAVANKMRLLSLPVEIQKALIEGRITEGHAKTILSVDSAEKQRAIFEMIIKSNLTVRQAEEKVKEVSVRPHKRNVSVDPEIRELEGRLVENLGTKVKVSRSGDGGKIVIEYYSKEDLESLLSKIL